MKQSAWPNSAWQQGADSAREGDNHCPYSSSTYDFVTWHNGWAAAVHLMEVEKERRRKPKMPNKPLPFRIKGREAS